MPLEFFANWLEAIDNFKIKKTVYEEQTVKGTKSEQKKVLRKVEKEIPLGYLFNGLSVTETKLECGHVRADTEDSWTCFKLHFSEAVTRKIAEAEAVAAAVAARQTGGAGKGGGGGGGCGGWGGSNVGHERVFISGTLPPTNNMGFASTATTS